MHSRAVVPRVPACTAMCADMLPVRRAWWRAPDVAAWGMTGWVKSGCVGLVIFWDAFSTMAQNSYRECRFGPKFRPMGRNNFGPKAIRSPNCSGGPQVGHTSPGSTEGGLTYYMRGVMPASNCSNAVKGWRFSVISSVPDESLLGVYSALLRGYGNATLALSAAQCCQVTRETTW